MINIIQRVLDRLREDFDEDLTEDVSSEYEPSDLSDDTATTLDPPPIELHCTVLRGADPATGTECPICIDELRIRQHACVLKCTHTFHKRCLKTWVDHDSTQRCPTCRSAIACEPPVVRRSPRASARGA